MAKSARVLSREMRGLGLLEPSQWPLPLPPELSKERALSYRVMCFQLCRLCFRFLSVIVKHWSTSYWVRAIHSGGYSIFLGGLSRPVLKTLTYFRPKYTIFHALLRDSVRDIDARDDVRFFFVMQFLRRHITGKIPDQTDRIQSKKGNYSIPYFRLELPMIPFGLAHTYMAYVCVHIAIRISEIWRADCGRASTSKIFARKRSKSREKATIPVPPSSGRLMSTIGPPIEDRGGIDPVAMPTRPTDMNMFQERAPGLTVRELIKADWHVARLSHLDFRQTTFLETRPTATTAHAKHVLGGLLKSNFSLSACSTPNHQMQFLL